MKVAIELTYKNVQKPMIKKSSETEFNIPQTCTYHRDSPTANHLHI